MTILADCEGIDEAAEWADEFGLTMPVWCDSGRTVWSVSAYADGPYKPQAIVIDRDMTIIAKENGPNAFELGEAAVIDAL